MKDAREEEIKLVSMVRLNHAGLYLFLERCLKTEKDLDSVILLALRTVSAEHPMELFLRIILYNIAGAADVINGNVIILCQN